MSTATGNLSIEAQARYAFVEQLLRADFAPPARVVELGAAPGDQIAKLAKFGFKATSVDLGESSDQWGDGTTGRMTLPARRGGRRRRHVGPRAGALPAGQQ